MPGTLSEYLAAHDDSRALMERVREIMRSLGPTTERMTKSQVAFRRRGTVAWAWAPGQYRKGRGVPLVLTLYFEYRHPSPRWKEIVETRSGLFTHHLELSDPVEIDREVTGWLRDAFERAG